ncbi:MAG: ABC transporter permease [Bacteroidota bacterium]
MSNKCNQHGKSPPQWATRFLRWYCRPELLDEVEGDLYELFQRRVATKGLQKARRRYWINVLMFFQPAYIRKRKRYSTNHTAMLRHNFLISFRNFQRHRSTFFINLVGLSSGLACALLIFMWVTDELSIDKFHEKDAQLFQLLEQGKNSEGIWVGEYTSGLMAETLIEEIPEVEHAVATRLREEGVTLSIDNKYIRASALFASEDFFNVFSFDLTQGSRDQVLADKNSIAISEELAMNLFNTTENIIGKTVNFQDDQPFRVAGVFANVPTNSSLQFDFVLSFEKFKEIEPNTLDWNFNTTKVYAVLQETASVQEFRSKIAGLLKEKRNNSNSTLLARPFSDGYLYGNYENGKQIRGRIEYVRLFSIIAIFILLIACINFMNLATAKASRRLKEVGVKKAIGAKRKTLIFQYLSESLLMASASLLIAILLVLLFLPQFNEITGKQLNLNLDVALVGTIVGIVLFTGLIAGSYPAFYLSGLDSVTMMRGHTLGILRNATKGKWARRSLVIFQFALSVLLIVSVVVVYQQIDFVQTKNLGYEKDNVLYFDIEGRVGEQLETFLSELRSVPGVVNAASIGQSIVDGSNSFSIDNWPGKPEGVDFPSFEMRPVTYDLLETLGVEIATGRTFSSEFSSEGSKIIFNQAAVDMMGLSDPIGEIIRIGQTELEIIGVAKNFHFRSLHEEVSPLFFVLRPSWTHQVVAKIEAGREREAIDNLQEFYQAYNPGYSFSYQFLDTDYQALYAAEQRVSKLSKYFAGIAIIISCLGLFGLATFTAERRLKEIGIRKALGASNFRIVRLLSAEFTQMVLMAILIALPISYFIAQQWLNDFAFSIDLRWWYFAGAGLIALLTAWFTVGFQTIKAARVNPVQCLRDE